VDGEIGIGLRKARELLAFLAVHGADGAIGDAISEALWPGAPPGHGNASATSRSAKHANCSAARPAATLPCGSPWPPTGTALIPP
jgi:hypothetical protein